MINLRNTLGVIFFILIIIYKIFGVSDIDRPEESAIWDSIYFCTMNALFFWMGHLILKAYRDKLLKLIIEIILSVITIEAVLNLYSVVNIDGFNKLNQLHEIGAITILFVLIFLIYSKNGRLAKE